MFNEDDETWSRTAPLHPHMHKSSHPNKSGKKTHGCYLTVKELHFTLRTQQISGVTNKETRNSYNHDLQAPPISRRIRNKNTNTVPIVQPTRCTCYLKLFTLVKRSTCFGRSFHPSSGAQNCVYSNGICQTAAATCCYRGWDETAFHLIVAVWHIVAVYAVLISWWWTERPSETCRAFYKNK